MEFGSIMLLFVLGIITLFLVGIFTVNSMLINLIPVFLSLFPLILFLYPLYLSKRFVSYLLIFVLLPWLTLPLGFISLTNGVIKLIIPILAIVWSVFNVILPRAQLEYIVAVQKAYLKADYSYSQSTVRTLRIVWAILSALLIFNLFISPIGNLTYPFG